MTAQDDTQIPYETQAFDQDAANVICFLYQKYQRTGRTEDIVILLRACEKYDRDYVYSLIGAAADYESVIGS